MTTNIFNLLEPVESQSDLDTYQDPGTKTQDTRCSTFIPGNQMLVKGEYNNEHSTRRNAMLIFFDTEKGREIGKNGLVLDYYSLTFVLTFRERKDIESEEHLECTSLEVGRGDLRIRNGQWRTHGHFPSKRHPGGGTDR
jgi:hypothetical protein